MSQVQFSPLSIYKSIDENRCGCDSEVAKVVADRGIIPTYWQDHAAKYRPTEIVAVTSWDEAVACIERGFRVRTAQDDRDDLRSAFEPIGNGNYSEAGQ